MSTLPIAVLAAGASRRLGTPKQLARYRGRTLLAHAISTAQAVGCGPVVVVLGAGADTLLGEIPSHPDVRAVLNPDWASGLGSSVRVAVDAALAAVSAAPGLLLTLCDQPQVTTDLLAEIAAAHREGHALVAASYDGVVGVPALFARAHFAELRALDGDRGARAVLHRHASRVHAVPDAAGAWDIDTPADLARLTHA